MWRAARWAEFVALFVGAPLAMALFLPRGGLFPALALFTLGGVALIWWTGEFDWRELRRGWSRIDWLRMAAFGLFVGATGYLVMAASQPGFVPNTSPQRLRFLAMLWLLYPILSALPQELIFRALYFHRYAALMGDARTARLVNAAIFSLAHLMYWSVVVAVMTFVGGWIFAKLYQDKGFPAAWVAHAIAGNMLFTVGMGHYFWSGNVVRPF
ncbi:CPBP family intramembrane glutamic endopeptidase [Paracoccus sphaerophysae]|uniref:Abortive infection protein n=1 Tax=Paracoccus sphaerophysae TaxID=690417 RepID=A0A099EVK3_9RHOB|nr:CPBP family intramembrane glutamic endopeptidase [Paracoccus sphaerophysae]KGJ01992.1 abortive infection protein [Paracoccus sphaerophysae]